MLFFGIEFMIHKSSTLNFILITEGAKNSHTLNPLFSFQINGIQIQMILFHFNLYF